MIRKYAFINAKVKARRSLRLSEDFLRLLRRSRSLQEAVQLFRDTPYRPLTEVYNETGDLRLVEKELLKLEIDLYRKIRPFLPEEAARFSASLFLRYEVDSLKFALRLWFAQSIRGQNISRQIGYFLPVNINHPLDHPGIINASEPEQLLSLMEGTPYWEEVRESLSRCRRDKTLFPSEWQLDRYFYAQLLGQLGSLGRKDRQDAEKVVRHMTDKQNLLTLLLFRDSSIFPETDLDRFYLPGGRKMDRKMFRGAFDLAEPDFRDLLHSLFPRLSFQAVGQALPLLFQDLESDLNLLSRRLAAGDPFSIGVILSWYLSGQEELKTIKKILNDKYYEGGA